MRFVVTDMIFAFYLFDLDSERDFRCAVLRFPRELIMKKISSTIIPLLGSLHFKLSLPL